MIVTLTPNPSIDRTLRVPPLERGAVVRASSSVSEAGGKGLNVSRALASQGVATTAVVPLSLGSAAMIRALLGTTVAIEPVTIAGEIRVNLSLVEADGTVTKINEPGPELGPNDVEGLLERATRLAANAAWVVGSGSLPPGAPADFYGLLAGRLRGSARVAIDTDSEALRACVGRRIHLLKPNHRELQQLVGVPLQTLGAVEAAARDLVRQGATTVLVSLSRDGALYVDAETSIHGEALLDDVVNPVGAGDALLAGYLAAGGLRTSLATAISWSAAACRSPGSHMEPLTERDRSSVVIHERVETERRLAS
jgi:1-phosphofructokinase family hexose kinase